MSTWSKKLFQPSESHRSPATGVVLSHEATIRSLRRELISRKEDRQRNREEAVMYQTRADRAVEGMNSCNEDIANIERAIEILEADDLSRGVEYLPET